MLDFAEKLTRTPSAVGQADVDAVLAAGFSAEEALDIIAVTALFNFNNRLTLGLGLDPGEALTRRRAEGEARAAGKD
jgi:uncharacterized peroxidase-related enzyme